MPNPPLPFFPLPALLRIKSKICFVFPEVIMEFIRLQKFFSDRGILSRRAAEAEIAAGNVMVNGFPAEIGMKIDPETDTVIYKGKKLSPVHGPTDRTYIMLNKPIGYVTTMKDEKGRTTAADLLRGVGKRVYPIGRLDMYSDGMLLFTDDGELANRMMHPSHHVEKEYHLTLKGTLTQEDALRYTEPMTLDGYPLRPVEAALMESGIQQPGGQIGSTLSVILHEGRNRQIRRMSEILGYTVLRLTRVCTGELQLGDLPIGKWRYLTEDEIQYLKSI
jgi:23S rRNA pseudouridine2605 synthase